MLLFKMGTMARILIFVSFVIADELSNPIPILREMENGVLVKNIGFLLQGG